MASDSFDLFCLSCNILVSANVVAQGSGGFRSTALNPMDVEDAEYHGDHYSVALCGRCSSPFLVREALYGIPGEFETVTDTEILYPITTRFPLENVPDVVKKAYDQAARSFVVALYDPCALMCRWCLEAVCQSFGVTGSNLSKKLEALATAGYIDSRMVEWAHGVRLLGNDAAHEIEIDVSKDDARDVLDFTEALLMYVFSLTHRFAAFSARRVSSERSQSNTIPTTL